MAGPLGCDVRYERSCPVNRHRRDNKNEIAAQVSPPSETSTSFLKHLSKQDVDGRVKPGHDANGLDANQETRQPVSKQCLVKVFPFRIKAMNELDFPCSRPMFYRLLSLNGIAGIVEDLVVNQQLGRPRDGAGRGASRERRAAAGLLDKGGVSAFSSCGQGVEDAGVGDGPRH
jgi:hypothetical protein